MAWDCCCEKGMRGGAYPASGRDAMGFSFCAGGLRATAVLMAGLVAGSLHFGLQYLPSQATASEAETTYAACPCNACADADCAWLKETTQQSEHVWLANELLYANGTMDSAYDIFLGFSEPEYQWIAEQVIDDSVLSYAVAFKKMLSDYPESVAARDVYESVLLSWLGDSDDEESNSLDAQLDYLSNLYDTYNPAVTVQVGALTSFSDLYEVFEETFGKKAVQSQEFSSFMSGLDKLGIGFDAMQIAWTTVDNAIDAMKAMHTVLGAAPEKIALLQYARDASVGYDDAFVEAADRVIDAYKGETSKLSYAEIAKGVKGGTWEAVKTVLLAKNPIIGLASDALDLFTGADEAASADMLMLGINTTADRLRMGLRAAADKQYSSVGTGVTSEDDAADFVQCFQSFLGYQCYALGEARDWARYCIDPASGTGRYATVSSEGREGAEAIIDACNSQISEREMLLEVIKTSDSKYIKATEDVQTGTCACDACDEAENANYSEPPRDIKIQLGAELEAAGCNSTYFWCADYDHDGSYEAFAIDGTFEAEDDGGVVNGSLWFTAGPGTTRIVEPLPGAHPATQNSGVQCGLSCNFLSVFIYGHGSGGSTRVYTVRNGEPVTVESGGMEGLWAAGNGTFIAGTDIWGENGGHSYGEEYLQWDEASFSFIPLSSDPEPSEDMEEASTSASPFDDFVAGLGITDHEVEYLYRSTGYPDFNWIVSGDLADETPVGSLVRDYDGDGAPELLVAVWRNGMVDLDMYELADGAVTRAAKMSDRVTDLVYTAITGDCVFNVLANDAGTIYLQWWDSGSPRADGFGWTAMRIGYADGMFIESGFATEGGSGGIDFTDLRAEMDYLGLDTSYVPRGLDDAFIHSDLAECDSSLTLVAKAVGMIDDARGASEAARAASEANPASGHLGTFKIGPHVASPEEWAWAPAGGTSAVSPTYSDVNPTYADATNAPTVASVDTKNGTVQYSCYWDANVDIATTDGGVRTLHSFYVTNLSYAPSSAAAGQHVEGFILTSGNHCIYWSGQATGGSLAIDQLWYIEDGVSFPVTVTSYDIDGFHWFGHDGAEEFRIS